MRTIFERNEESMKKLLSILCALVLVVSAMSVMAFAAEGDLVLFEGSQTIENIWNWDGMPLDFSDPSKIVEGSYLTVTYTGANSNAVYVVLEAPSLWVDGSQNHYVQLDNTDSCTTNDDGSFTSTFTYAQFAAANAEKNMDFSKVEKLRVGGNNEGAGITVTNVTWHAPASAEPDPTEPEATEPEATEPEATKPPVQPEVRVNLFSGSHDPLTSGSADIGVRIVSTEHEGTTDPYVGTFDPTVMVSGGYFTVTYTGPEGAARIQLKDDVAWGYVTVEPRATVQNGDGWVSYFYYDDIVSDLDFTTDLFMLFACASWDVTAETPVVITDVTWVTPGSSAETGDSSVIVIASAAVLASVIGMTAIVSKRRFAV